MKKALYIGGFEMPDKNAAAQRVLGVAKLLRQCSYQVHFVGLTHDKDNNCGKIEDFTFVNLPYPKTIKDWISYLFGLYEIINVINEFNPDIVILYNHPAFSIERIARYCRKRSIRVVADITEWDEPNGNFLYNLIKGYESKRRMYKSHFNLDGLICISQYLTDFYSNSNLPIIKLPPLVDIKQPKWSHATSVNPEFIKIVYAGSPGSKKDRIDIVVEALDRIISQNNISIKFDIIGITKKQFESTWNKYKEYNFINFNGRLAHDEVVKKLIDADFQIFLRPENLSNRAGFPTKFVETISSRTIPITNLSSNLSDYLIDGYNGFVIPTMAETDVKDTIYRALSLDKDGIQSVKSRINTTTFDFRNYLPEFQDFLGLL